MQLAQDWSLEVNLRLRRLHVWHHRLVGEGVDNLAVDEPSAHRPREAVGDDVPLSPLDYLFLLLVVPSEHKAAYPSRERQDGGAYQVQGDEP